MNDNKIAYDRRKARQKELKWQPLFNSAESQHDRVQKQRIMAGRIRQDGKVKKHA